MERGTIAIPIAVAFTTLSSCVLILRCTSRFITVQKAGSDDVSVVVAGLSSIALTCFIYAQSQHGLGRDVDSVSPHDLKLMLKYFWLHVMAYGSGMTFLKMSALLQYLRFLVERPARILCWVLIAANSLFGVAAFFTNVFACRPFNFWWDKTLPYGECINLAAWWYSAAAWTIITDIIVVAIPITVLKDLTMPRSQKIGLIAVFALGGFGCVTFILRLHALYIATTSTDITRGSAPAQWWSSIELNVGIICMSLPPLKALVIAAKPRFMIFKDIDKSSGTGFSSLDEQRLRFPASLQSEKTATNGTPDPWIVP